MTITDPHSTEQRLRRFISTAHIEVIPLKGAQDKVGAAPPNSTLTFTCSPKFGLERTLEHAANAVAQGYQVIPHLAARKGRAGEPSEVASVALFPASDLSSYMTGTVLEVSGGRFM